MSGVEIERLTLDVPGLDQVQGERLGEKIAALLSAKRWMPAQSTEHVSVALSPPPDGASLDHLADLIVAELRRRML